MHNQSIISVSLNNPYYYVTSVDPAKMDNPECLWNQVSENR